MSPSRLLLALLVVSLAPGCGVFARSDARLKAGHKHVGLSLAVMHTPDAYVEHDQDGLVQPHIPERTDGANVRATGELSLGRSWQTFDLTLRLPLPQVMRHEEFIHPTTDAVLLLFYQRWDFYFAMPEHRPWFWGLGVEVALGPALYAVVTREFPAGSALSLTARVVKGPRESILQGQLAYTLPGTGSNVLVFAAVFRALGDSAEIREGCYCEKEVQDTRASTFTLVGATFILDR